MPPSFIWPENELGQYSKKLCILSHKAFSRKRIYFMQSEWWRFTNCFRQDNLELLWRKVWTEYLFFGRKLFNFSELFSPFLTTVGIILHHKMRFFSKNTIFFMFLGWLVLSLVVLIMTNNKILKNMEIFQRKIKDFSFMARRFSYLIREIMCQFSQEFIQNCFHQSEDRRENKVEPEATRCCTKTFQEWPRLAKEKYSRLTSFLIRLKVTQNRWNSLEIGMSTEFNAVFCFFFLTLKRKFSSWNSSVGQN